MTSQIRGKLDKTYWYEENHAILRFCSKSILFLFAPISRKMITNSYNDTFLYIALHRVQAWLNQH